MIINARPMACGNCGHGLFQFFYQEHPTDGLMAECAKCLSVTMIGVTEPKLELRWGEDADGILCPMEPKP